MDAKAKAILKSASIMYTLSLIIIFILSRSKSIRKNYTLFMIVFVLTFIVILFILLPFAKKLMLFNTERIADKSAEIMAIIILLILKVLN